MAKPWRPVTPSSLGTTDGALSMKPSKTPQTPLPDAPALPTLKVARLRPPHSRSVWTLALNEVLLPSKVKMGLTGGRASGLPSNNRRKRPKRCIVAAVS